MIRMMRISCLFLLLILMLTGCSSGQSDSAQDVKEPETVAILFSSLAEIWLDAGGEIDIMVGETIERGFAPEGTPLVDEGAGKTINLELLISLQPDLVIVSQDIPAQAEAVPVLEKAGIDTLLCRVESFADYLAALEAMTRITGNTDALEYGNVMQQEIDGILAQMEGNSPRILFVRAGSSASSTKAKRAEDHFACAMLEEMGCYNIAANAPVLLDGLSMEEILLEDPDYIFFSLMGKEESALANVQSLLSGETWGRLTAVQEGNAVILPKDLFHFKPCRRWVEAYRYLAEILNGVTHS